MTFPARAALVICDMWDTHHCATAAERARALAPRIHGFAARLRAAGALIIHAPGDCVAYYDGTPARTRATSAPRAAAPAPIRWNPWNPDREATLAASITDPGPCMCEAAEPCCEAGPPYPWTRQNPSIHIAPRDAVSDDGQEVYNLLEQHGVENVVVVGVHTNVCVLSRAYGIRQLVYLGKKPLLCSDLTDSFLSDPRGHARGHRDVLTHIERYWCPTLTSEQLLGRMSA